MGIDVFYLKSDSLITLAGLVDEADEYVLDATVTMSLFKQETFNIDACRLDFTGGGVAEPAIGDVLLGATDAAWARIVSIVLVTGAWADGNAVGYFILIGQQGTFRAAGENLNQVDGQADICTISSDSLGSQTADGGAKTLISVNGHNLFSYNNFCFIEGTQAYDGQQVISAWAYNSFTINAAWGASEKFIGNEKVYVGIPNGKDIALAYDDPSDGVYAGTLPDSVKGLIEQESVYLFITVVDGATTLIIRIQLKADYKDETDIVSA